MPRSTVAQSRAAVCTCCAQPHPAPDSTHAAVMTNLMRNELVSTDVLCMASRFSCDSRLSSASDVMWHTALLCGHLRAPQGCRCTPGAAMHLHGTCTTPRLTHVGHEHAPGEHEEDDKRDGGHRQVQQVRHGPAVDVRILLRSRGAVLRATCFAGVTTALQVVETPQQDSPAGSPCRSRALRSTGSPWRSTADSWWRCPAPGRRSGQRP